MDDKGKRDHGKDTDVHTVEVEGEKVPRNGAASDGVIGGSGGKGGGQSSLTSAGNEKIPPRR